MVAGSPGNGPRSLQPVPSAARTPEQTRSRHAERAQGPALVGVRAKRREEEEAESEVWGKFQWNREGDKEEMRTPGNNEVTSSTCGYGQRGWAPGRRSSHPLCTHGVAAALCQPGYHGDALLLGHGERGRGRVVGHGDSVEVKLSESSVPAHRDGGRVRVG